MDRSFLNRVALSCLPLAAAVLMSAVSQLCYRTGPFRACSQRPSGYQASIVCQNAVGEPWSCPAGTPTQNEFVTRCATVNAGEAGNELCLNLDTHGKCSWLKPKCGPNPGDCLMDTQTTTVRVPMQIATGGHCEGPSQP